MSEEKPKPRLFQPRCEICGRPANYGKGVRLTQEERGVWRCKADIWPDFMPKKGE